MKIKYQGIYGIFDKDGSCWYIGQSIDIERRWKVHKGKIHDEWHNEMQSRLDDFTFKILELVDDIDKLREREDYYIDLYNPKYTSKKANRLSQVGPSWNKGLDGPAPWNAGKTGVYNEVTIKRMKKSQKEAWADPELRKRDSEKQKEVWADPELRKRHSEKQKEAWADPELRKRHSEKCKGRTQYNKGKIYITNGTDEQLIPKNDYDNYDHTIWKRGRKKQLK